MPIYLYPPRCLRQFINDLRYEIVENIIDDMSKYPTNRDVKDIPVLAYAIEGNADVFITGDSDFDDIEIEKPKILKVKDYMNEYMQS